MSTELQKVYGIDLGTTYSCIAVVDETGKPVVLRNKENTATTPSVVFFDGDNIIAGQEAKKHAKLYPGDVVEMVKRSMGDANYLFEHNGESYRAEEISAYVLRKLVGDVKEISGDEVTDVVITCPAYFGVNEREATANAGRIAGLNVRSIVNEPTAAAIAYGLEKGSDQTVLVYDLGGGTFDVTMIEIKDTAITVICTGGDHNRGGKDWDMAVVNYLEQEFQQQTGTSEDILDDPDTLQDLMLQAEEAKKTLTTRDKARLKVTHGAESIRVELTRDRFNEITSQLLEQTITLTQEMLREAAQKGHKAYDRILLVGGSTKMPQVAERLRQEFDVEIVSYDPDEAVAKGAAVYGWKLALDEEIKTAIAGETGQDADSVDLEKVDEAAMKNARKEVAEKFALPPKAVENASKKIIGVTSKTFGIVALDGDRREWVFNLIRRNDPVPTDVTETFGTIDDNQPSVEVRLMENLELNQKTDVSNATEIGKADLPMPPGMPAGSPVNVTFRLTEQGRLEVLATEPSTNETVSIEVETASVMSDDAVEAAKSKGLIRNVS